MGGLGDKVNMVPPVLPDVFNYDTAYWDVSCYSYFNV